MWPMNPRVIVLVAGIALACAASSTLGYKLGRASGDRDVRKMLEAGQKVLAEHQKRTEVALNEYRDELVIANNRPPRRVFFCPSGNLPEASGGTTATDSATSYRRADGTDIRDFDYGPSLREARDTLIRCKKLIKVVK